MFKIFEDMYAMLWEFIYSLLAALGYDGNVKPVV